MSDCEAWPVTFCHFVVDVWFHLQSISVKISTRPMSAFNSWHKVQGSLIWHFTTQSCSRLLLGWVWSFSNTSYNHINVTALSLLSNNRTTVELRGQGAKRVVFKTHHESKMYIHFCIIFKSLTDYWNFPEWCNSLRWTLSQHCLSNTSFWVNKAADYTVLNVVIIKSTHNVNLICLHWWK